MGAQRTTFSVAALQSDPAFGEVAANLAAVEAAIDGLEADLLVLPELFSTGYSFRDRAEARALAEPFPGGDTCARVLAWSEATGGMVVAGFAERDGEALYNAAMVVAAGRPLGSYRKIHLFGFERECFDPGDRPFPVHEHEGLRVGTMICFDWIYPEAARTLALRGADVIAHPSNLVLPGWCQQAMVIRALENRLVTVTANRHGSEARPPRPALSFTGTSRIVGPDGTVLADAPPAANALLVAEVDVRASRDKQVPSGNDLFLERRPRWYGELTAEPE